MDSNIEVSFLSALSFDEGRRFGDGDSSAREREVERDLRLRCEGIKKTVRKLFSWSRKTAEKNPVHGSKHSGKSCRECWEHMVCALGVSWDYITPSFSWGVPLGVLKAWIEAQVSGQYLLYSHIFLPSSVHIISIILAGIIVIVPI